MLSLGTLRFPMLHFGRRALFGAVVIPSAAAGGSYAYIQYRLSTKPTFTPRILVDHNGQLLEHGGIRVPHISSVSIIMRALQLLVMYAPLLAVYPLLCHFRRVYIFWLRVLLAVVQRSGPAMIKFGQWICTRHDMVSIEFRTVFHALYSHVHTHPSAISIQTIEEELGAPLDTWFSEFDPVPIGSGSIGQCHRAVWKPTGEEVVIKVMHPNVIHDVTIDIYLINWAANWISQLSSSSQYMRLPRTALAWTNHLAAQINFNIEAENLSIFRANFAHGKYATFPAPVHSTPRLLVETFAKGELATDEYLQSLPKASRDLVAYIGLNTLCQMILRDNLIHCDMHPGNIIIDASTDPHHPKVTLIDVGLAQHLTPMDANIMDALISGYVHWNAESTARAMLSMSQNQDFCDEAVFIERMNSLFAYFRPGGEGAEYAVVGNVLHGCFDAVRESHVQLDPQFVHIMLAVLVLEGLIMKLNPLFNIAQQAAPWLVGEGYISTSVWKNLTKTLWVRQKHFLERIVGKYSDQSLEWKS